jgi:hypothetical protein
MYSIACWLKIWRYIMKYDRVLIFTKNGNLLDYLNTYRVCGRIPNLSDKEKEYYALEREIQLIACIRWEDFPVSTSKGIVQAPKCFCKIKCPVNPLPVKGEFELPSIDVLRSFLKANGWKLQQTLTSWMFK